jgi:hypothetical protein
LDERTADGCAVGTMTSLFVPVALTSAGFPECTLAERALVDESFGAMLRHRAELSRI